MKKNKKVVVPHPIVAYFRVGRKEQIDTKLKATEKKK